MRSQPAVVRALYLFGLLAARTAHADGSCESFQATEVGVPLDLAAPKGYVEVCSRSAELCRDLTAGYPPDLQNLAYFVKADEWKAYSTGDHRPFRSYLIAQRSTSTLPQHFDQLKNGIRTQQGARRAKLQLPSPPTAGSKTPLGVVDEARDAIVFGVVVTAKPDEPNEPVFTEVALNAAFLLKASVLSLYVFGPFQSPADVESSRRTTAAWLQCMRQANTPARPVKR